MGARRGAALALAACLAMSACGGSSSGEERATAAAGTGGEAPSDIVPPGPTPQPLEYVGGAKAALAAGAVAVVDLSNRVGVEPSRMDVNREQRLSALRWSGWGGARAVGQGAVRTLVCEPTCAGGRVEESRGTIVLSAPRRCRGRRFYTRSSMTYEERSTGRTRAPATYLRTPPC
jgi:hypothetical protein